ncbi:protein TAPT1 homolog [Hyposmocoma kahamanoa]|uniref:protein TAPT1 homolog n=1 Tax=Hyposmocoma kahamanoa TaxID=1477025 RepID=UPI000E6D61D5|nr:protein TAPT1 homolog [Hyposmocoma kahamanoa]
MVVKNEDLQEHTKRLRFKPLTNIQHSSANIDDSKCSKDLKTKDGDKSASLFAFLHIELTRGYLLEHDEERFSARREKVYSFIKIPQELEKFMVYGFFQCADSLLFVYTFLPLRFIMAFWSFFTRLFRKCFGLYATRKNILKPAETCDMLKGFILLICSILMCYIDTNMMYHLVKSQSVMKLYIFYNMLEVGDRLFSAFGQDTIDALFWTATEPRDRRREHLGVIPHLLFAMTYVFLHSLLVLFQATTLNVAFNSNNKSLLIIMMSNNFVELKGSVFKKFDKNNLFQVSCSDVRERLHLSVLLFIVVLQTMKEFTWREERFWILAPDCVLVLTFEVIIDWVKHAFITRFNEIPYGVYREYTVSLAYDVAQTRQKYAFSDHSDLVARRMGFIPLPLGVVITRVLVHAVKIDGFAAVFLIFIAYICLISIRVLVSIVILGKACDLISQHQTEKNESHHTTPKKESKELSTKEILYPHKTLEANSTPVKKSVQLKFNIPEDVVLVEPLVDASVGAAAIFSNSAIDLNGVCYLNDKMNAQVKQEPTDYLYAEPDLVDVSRSAPDIKAAAAAGDAAQPAEPDRPHSPDADGLKRRSESEPNLVKQDEEAP